MRASLCAPPMKWTSSNGFSSPHHVARPGASGSVGDRCAAMRGRVRPIRTTPRMAGKRMAATDQ